MRERKRVLCVETNIIYKSTVEAGWHMKINSSNIANVCRGLRKKANDHIFSYYDGPLEGIDVGMPRKPRKKEEKPRPGHSETTKRVLKEKHLKMLNDMTNPNAKRVICVETDEVYQSIHEAGRVMGIGFEGIAKACKNQELTAAGYHWAYYTNKKFKGRPAIGAI